MSSPIVEFYRLNEPDSVGRMLSEYWSWDDQTLEFCHDFIQWMFPLDEASAFNPDAPLLTEEDCEAFGRDSLLQNCVRRSLKRFMAFLGLEIGSEGAVGRSANFDRRIAVWNGMNHNWLRITRLLKSLRLLGMENEAREVWKCLKMLHNEDGYIPNDSFAYWMDAASGLE